jgi:hypothetical protein
MRVSRLTGALIAYLVLGVLAVATLSDERIRGVTLLILALFAVKSWVRRKDVLHPDGDKTEPSDLPECQNTGVHRIAEGKGSVGPM